MDHKCTLAAKKTNSLLGCIRDTITNKSREVILLSSALVRHI